MLHLPLRYEDETHVVSAVRAQARTRPCRSRASSSRPRSSTAPRRQLVVPARRRRASAVRSWCCASSTSIRPSRRRSRRASACASFGEVRGGFFGGEMVHPRFQVVDDGRAAADRADAGLSDDRAACRRTRCARLIARALAPTRALERHAAAQALAQPRGLWTLRDARALPAPPAAGASIASARSTTRTHPAWQRLKFDELLAQQLSLKRIAKRERRAQRAPRAARRAARCTTRCSRALPFALTRRAAARRAREIAHDLRAAASDAPPAAGRRRQRQDGRRGAGRAAGDRQPAGRPR